jgi:uncharacterized membrane protein HdeD (DUF308 family)
VLRILSRNWWLVALRGFLAVLFGIAAIVWPGATVQVLVILFGIYTLIDGLFALYSAFAGPERRAGWALLLLEALADIATGIIAFIWPQVTAVVLLYLIAAWAVVTGILELIAAFRLRREVEGEWFLGLAGVVSIIVGILLALRPLSGLVAIALVIGTYAIIFGILLIVLGFRLRGFREQTV